MIWDLCACCLRWQWRVDWPPCAELQIRTSWLSDDANPKVEDSSARRIYIICLHLVSRSKLFDLNKKCSATFWGWLRNLLSFFTAMRAGDNFCTSSTATR